MSAQDPEKEPEKQGATESSGGSGARGTKKAAAKKTTAKKSTASRSSTKKTAAKKTTAKKSTAKKSTASKSSTKKTAAKKAAAKKAATNKTDTNKTEVPEEEAQRKGTGQPEDREPAESRGEPQDAKDAGRRAEDSTKAAEEAADEAADGAKDAGDKASTAGSKSGGFIGGLVTSGGDMAVNMVVKLITDASKSVGALAERVEEWGANDSAGAAEDSEEAEGQPESDDQAASGEEDATDEGSGASEAPDEGDEEASAETDRPTIPAMGDEAKEFLSGVSGRVRDVIPGVFHGPSGGDDDDKSFTNIVETVDIGAPVSVVYNAFSEFEQWPTYMRKVESADKVDDTRVRIKARVLRVHRTWEASIVEMVPDSHIVWESSGEKGSIAGAVSFHEIAPRLTRMVVIGEYHPQGFMERVGNLRWAVPRRLRLELRFFAHHIMTNMLTESTAPEGWRGEIHDGKVVKTHEDAVGKGSEETADDTDAKDSRGEKTEHASEGEGAEVEYVDEQGNPVDPEDVEGEDAEYVPEDVAD